MNLHFQEIISQELDDNSRVWIYQCSRAFSPEEILQINEALKEFSDKWLSHGAKIKGFAKIFLNQFIVIIADESKSGVSGCSTDSSVHIIKNIEMHYKVDLFNRQMLAFIINENVQIIPLSDFNSSVQNNLITTETFYFDNTVQTKKELISNWVIPVKYSWLNKKLLRLEQQPSANINS